jgi:general secretion pathway protein F
VVSGITAALLIFILVVPRFAGMLGDKADQLPLLAYTVLSSGMFLNQHWPWVAGFGAGLLVFAVMIVKKPLWRKNFYDSLSRLPMLGGWIVEAETGRWAAMLGTLLENRVPMLRALELAQAGMQLSSFNARLSQVSKAVRAGSSLADALIDNQAITSTGHNLIRAGERAGELPRMLRSLAKLYTESGRVRMKRFLLLLEPLAILTIGAVIGFIITGVILAITSVNQIGV